LVVGAQKASPLVLSNRVKVFLSTPVLRRIQVLTLMNMNKIFGKK